MTDARFPSRWLADRRILRLPPVHLASFVFAMMYAAESRTDGLLDDGDLAVIPRYNAESTAILIQHDLLQPTEDGHWLLSDFAATQTTAAELKAQEQRRIRARDKKRTQRGRGPAADAPAAETAPPVTDWDTTLIPE